MVPSSRPRPTPGRRPDPIPAIDPARLAADLEALARIGGDGSGRAVNRPSFGAADMAARAWLLERCREIGLSARLDAAGNAIGRWETGAGPAIMAGSHLDSVPDGGIFDGALGVLAALECVRALKESGIDPGCPIEIVGTAEEEGRFGGMLGSQAMAGLVDPDWFANAAAEDGTPLRDAMRAAGLDPDRIGEARRAPDELRAFLELHVEQGPLLERRGNPVGIVTGISGVFNWAATLIGEANHAGTTPMSMRRDAFRGLAEFAHAIPAAIDAHGTDESRVTIGHVAIEPNYMHTVPGRAHFALIGRDTDARIMDALDRALEDALHAAAGAHGLEIAIERPSRLDPAPCDPDIAAAFRKEAAAMGIDALEMPSGAGHDTQMMASVTRAGMIFVPSRGGVSHAPSEWTDLADIETGTNLLLRTILRLAETP